MRNTLNGFKKKHAVVFLCIATINGAGSVPTLAADKTIVASTETLSSAPPVELKKKRKDKQQGIILSQSSVRVEVNAPAEQVYQTLTNFDLYPQIFKRIKSCAVTRREGDLVYVETFLKPQMFVKQQCQHTINDLKGGPGRLEWTQLDGNFKHVDGTWEIRSLKADRTEVTYTLRLDAGPVVPSQLVSFLLKFVQKEVTGQLKAYVEHNPTRLSLARTSE